MTRAPEHYRRANYGRCMALRMKPEFRHLPAVLFELGWRTGKPTSTGFPRVFFREFEGKRWEVKRGPSGKWRMRFVAGYIQMGPKQYPRWEWWIPAPVFDNPTSAALWFDRVGTVLLKMEVK